MQEIKTYKTADLVLQVTKNYDPGRLNLRTWDRYIDLLCNDRQYQKEAIKKAIIFLASDIYKSIEDLVYENWSNNKMVELKSRYQSLDDYAHHLQMPKRLSASVDLATGTGKSYVMYGIAQIMLGLGLVDKVLVLCPSLTIEDGLLEKFKKLSQDSLLLNAIPEESKIKNPAIKTAELTIKMGDICVENIHAVYEKTGSSIKDSFLGQGDRTLVLNDEAHHIYNLIDGRDREAQDLKRWKEFLLSSTYNFKYILGFTGTAYIKDEYFNDVIYRYSLRQAVDQRVVKMVDYVSENNDEEIDIKFQQIYDNHLENINTYRRVKPLSILITKDIKAAKQLTALLSEFLSTKMHLSTAEVENKVLIVTSANEHKANVKRLKDVDKKSDSIEWIISVSMLTEGWDVKNVFQIVPWEDKAFNSKLLIAQVLGRGLRISYEAQRTDQKVRVFNHASWSRNIKGLVDEILEVEMKLISTPLTEGERSKYNFTVHNIDYDKEPIEKPSLKNHQVFDYTKGYFELKSQVIDAETETQYTNLSGSVSIKNTLIHYNTYTVDEIVKKIYDELKLREWEGKILKLPTGEYSKENLPPKDEIKIIIRNSMERYGIKGDSLNVDNKHKIESSFNTLLRKSSKSVVYERTAKDPRQISTIQMERESIAVGNLRHYSTVFYTPDYNTEIYDPEVKRILDAVIEDETFIFSSRKEINPYLFKTPLDIVFTSYEPERKFIEQLCKVDNASHVESWVKSRDLGFYSIEYSVTSIAGKHSKVQTFNPDFFIKLQQNSINHFIVVEIKFDGDTSLENKAKLKYAKQHFETLNFELKNRGINQKYHFHFLSPLDYVVFFDHLRNGQLIEGKFRSGLEDKLESDEVEEET